MTNKKGSNEFGGIFWLHLMLILLIYTSPFFLSWKVILFCIFLYYLQIVLIGTCLISLWQFHSAHGSFYAHYLARLGVRVDRTTLDFFEDYVLPWVIFFGALIWQVILKHAIVFS